MKLQDLIEPEAAALMRLYEENGLATQKKLNPNEALLVCLQASIALSMKRMADQGDVEINVATTRAMEEAKEEMARLAPKEFGYSVPHRYLADELAANAFKRTFGSSPQPRPSFWRRLWANLHGRAA